VKAATINIRTLVDYPFYRQQAF
jgi:hypothetical protein